jgi:NitT/TauT family transport system ATP-binding protein
VLANNSELTNAGTKRAQDAAGGSVVPILSVDGVTLQYKTKEHLVTATYQVSFDVYKADRFVLLGPSGCGKSTLLKGIAGFMKPVEGEIKLDGAVVRRPGPDRMMVFQEFDQLLPWKTVLENVIFPMRVSGKWRRAEAKERALAAIAKVNLTKFCDVHPHMLSGGMKQRVAIARAMAMEPKVLLMDEPFAALDALTRRKMQEELLELWNDVRFTVLFVTHSIEEAIIVGSRILVLSPHPGQVRAELNSHQFGHDEQGGAAFQKLHTEIHDMLFSEGVEQAPTLTETHNG